MKMYRNNGYHRTTLSVNTSVEGETLEQKIERILNNKEPIGQGQDSAPLIFTERKDGVQPQYDIRTDRWEIAVEATDKVAKSYKARREERIQGGSLKKDDKVESIHGKSETDTPKTA